MIGASMGGVIAQIIGVLHPERVTSLVLACTACRHHDWRRELLAEWAADVSEHGMKAMSRTTRMRWLVGPRLQRRFGVFSTCSRGCWCRRRPSRSSRRSTRSSTMPDEMRDELAHITAPTLVITGSQDTLTPLGDAEELAELITRLAARTCVAAPPTA